MTEFLTGTVVSRLEEFIRAPIDSPEILSMVIPLILGAFVVELYLGKHKTEDLGWNTSVGNAAIWIATGINLFLTEKLSSGEKYVSYFIIGAGLFVGYMDFYHKWSPKVAFRVSSADVVYPLAYLVVVIIKTDLPVDNTTLKAGSIFIVGSIVLFWLLKSFEKPARDTIGGFAG